MDEQLPEPLPLPPQPVAPNVGSVGKGILIGLAIAIGVGIAGAALVIPALGIGLFQLIWVIPMVRNYRKKGETETAKGLIIQAAIVGFLNAACWGVVIIGLSNADFR